MIHLFEESPVHLCVVVARNCSISGLERTNNRQSCPEPSQDEAEFQAYHAVNLMGDDRRSNLRKAPETIGKAIYRKGKSIAGKKQQLEK